jgi:TPP-dependent pyruvate/acetoin dehydrogenase alpha subunit
MRRFPAYDPPEYTHWEPDPEVIAAFHAVRDAQTPRGERARGCAPEALLGLYRGLVRARLHDITLKRWVKQGVISKAWLATGEEAATIGVVAALSPGDVVAPMIRNASACIEKGIPLAQMFSAYLATTQNPTQGRDLHIGAMAHDVITPISHVAAVAPVTAGVALSFKLDGASRVAVCWTGDGSTRCGEFHEALSLAAALQLPAIFIVQNNQVALGTQTAAHTRADFSALGAAYGIPTISADGNHVIDVWAATREAADIARAGHGPVVLVLTTFRMGGHATHDEAEARKLFPQETFSRWGARDPIGCFEAWLTTYGGVAPSTLQAIEAEATLEVEAAAQEALTHRPTHQPNPATAAHGVFCAQES